MVLKIKCWMVNHFKRIQHVFLVLNAIKCWMKNLLFNKFHPTPSNIIFFFFYELLDEIGAFKRIQYFVQHCRFRMLDEMLVPLKSALTQCTTKRKNCTFLLVIFLHINCSNFHTRYLQNYVSKNVRNFLIM